MDTEKRSDEVILARLPTSHAESAARNPCRSGFSFPTKKRRQRTARTRRSRRIIYEIANRALRRIGVLADPYPLSADLESANHPDETDGFTLVEMVVVVLVIGILTAAGMFAYISMVDKARVVQAIGDVKAISLSVDNYWMINDDYPPNLAAVGMNNYDDPWENNYVYTYVSNPAGGPRLDAGGNPINTDYELYSIGRDGATSAPLNAANARDDVVRGSNGGFTGLATNY